MIDEGQPIAASERQSGFSLLELLTVLGVIGVLAGMSLGLLQRRSKETDVALEMVRDQVRVAALTARTRRVPTAVLLEPGRDGGPARVRARVLVPVHQWQMEERELGLHELRPKEITGQLEPGRFGLARRPDEAATLLEVSTEATRETLFDLSEGFALHIDVKLDARGSEMTLVELDANLVLALDDALYPTLKFVSAGDGGEAGGSTTLEGSMPLRLHRWTTVSVIHDRSHLRLFVDDRLVASAPVSGRLFQGPADTFRVSPAGSYVVGLVDEVRLLAYDYTDEQVFEAGVELHSQYDRIEFGRDGRLVSPVEFAIVFGDEREVYSIGPGGVIE